jgi:Kef-type K+ transport system membrane component KefB
VRVLVDAAGLFLAFLVLKMVLKSAGIALPMLAADFSPKEVTFTALLMSSGLAFGSIVSLFGLEHGIIDREQYTVLVTAVIASGLVPTVIAQIWFQPEAPPRAS